MKNVTLGKIGAAVTGFAVLAFAVSMVFGLLTDSIFASCLASMFIAMGFIPFMCGLHSVSEDKNRTACGMAGVCFAVVYAVIIFLVYYAECTTLRMNRGLSEEALSIICYGHVGSLYFNYDLLGYGFMALSTFIIGLNLRITTKESKWLKAMLMIHGVFFISCFIIPMFPVFTASTSNLTGTILLEIWCVYFIPICILGYRYFRNAD